MQLCSSDVSYTISQNERWIRVCIFASYSTEGLDKLHLLLLQRLWSVAAAAESSDSAGQYQCFSTQYQSGACSDVLSAAVPSVHRQARPRSRPVVDPAPHYSAGRVLAAVVAREQRPANRPANPAVVRASSSDVRPERPRGAPEAAVRRREPVASSGGWLLSLLVALVALTLLGVLITALSEVPVVGTTVSGARARLASKGLSSSRIDLDNAAGAQPRRGRIAYRD